MNHFNVSRGGWSEVQIPSRLNFTVL